MNSGHRLDWEDGQLAKLEYCGDTRIPDGPVLSIDGNLSPRDYPDQACPICGKQLRLVWDVRAEVRE